MSRYCLFLLGTLLALCSAAWAVEEISVLYNGDRQLPQRIAMGFWGYRPVDLTEGNPFVPIRLSDRRYYGLKIVSVGRYEGVRFDFLEPMDLSSFIADKNAFLEIFLRSTAQGPVVNPAAPLVTQPEAAPPDMYPGMYPGMQPGYGMPGADVPPGMYPGAQPGYAMPGADVPPPMYPGAQPGYPPPGAVIPPGMDPAMQPAVGPYGAGQGARPYVGTPYGNVGNPYGTVGGPYGGGMPTAPPTAAEEPFVPQPDATVPNELGERKTQTVPLPQLKNIRITFYTDQGQGMLVVTPDQFYPKEEINKFWVRIGIPLSQMQKGTPIGGKLYRMVITSDEPTEFLVGRLAFVRDSDPIQASLFVFPPFLEAKRSIFFAARVEAGLTPYEVEWDFDTQAGESVDAVGERVTYAYPAEGLYTITCTVRDKTGAKEPVVSTLEVKISRPFEE